MATFFRNAQRLAHESPVIFWSLAIGFSGPAMVLTVPPIRKSFGYKQAERIPSTFPVPNRPRRSVSGYEDP
ncbi:uncharacterized protein IL334_002031 [Kwoniella shivajii]|uniref:NADH-ubiquinone oxidoreductase 9.5 kDa subunit n=1 Tax=Kwoniella shivajii TaxID=564305 RepID=A0ABZ1CV80_9TREE|nr:hypothetical protein IL334_002031 [Kwoniella shivajii]